ncbi:hypothetical protein [Glycomyces sp. NPDC021274]|uniref:hypothetical protein n=1 Tax=Glycomyces sp. NPDC021274 TaxID=3155120 RepID=UPI0033FDAB9A
MGDATFSGGDRDDDVPLFTARKVPPTSIVFGSDPDCEAVLHRRGPTPGRGVGLWLLTDRRFARFTFAYALPQADRDQHTDEDPDDSLPPEPMTLRTDLEVPTSTLRHEPDHERHLPRRFNPRTATYQRFILSDGSGFDISERNGDIATPGR